MSNGELAIVVILCTAIICGGMLWLKQSWGDIRAFTASDNERTRRSCAESADRAIRSEARRSEADLDIIEQVREMMKSLRESA
jgi:hypothetical protein